MKFDYLHLFKPIELDEKTHAEIQTNKNFLFKIGDKKYICVGGRIFSFETDDEITKYFSEDGHNDVKYPFALTNENNYYMLHQKFIPIEEYQNSTMKSEYQCLYKKDDELKGNNITDENEGIVEYGNDFINCKIVHSKQKKYYIFVNIFKHIVMTVKIHFVLHAANGILITIQV